MADIETLTFREIADRLGTSVEAARIRSKRKAKEGRWRIIEGNHPNDPKRVEMPRGDLDTKPKQSGATRGKIVPPTVQPSTEENEHLNAYTSHLVSSLSEAQGRVRELTEQLIKAKDAHRRDAMELAAAEMRELGTKAELERALVDIEALKEQLRLLLADQRKSWWRRVFG